jgi:hypothetical protein
MLGIKSKEFFILLHLLPESIILSWSHFGHKRLEFIKRVKFNFLKISKIQTSS